MALWVSMMISFESPGLTWWEVRTDPCRLSADFQLRVNDIYVFQTFTAWLPKTFPEIRPASMTQSVKDNSLSHCSIPVKRHNNQVNSYEREHLIGLGASLQFQVSPLSLRWEHGAGAAGRESETLDISRAFETSMPTPSDKTFSEATPPNLF